MVGNNMYQNQNPMPYPPMQPGFYNQMPPGVNWQNEMLSRISALQQQIQNSFPQQMQQQPVQQQGFLKGRVVGSKEEVYSAQVDFTEPQFFPVGEDSIYVKRLGMDGKSQVLEYRLNTNQSTKADESNNNTNAGLDFLDNFNTLKQNYDLLISKYNEIYNELSSIKKELGIAEGVRNE